MTHASTASKSMTIGEAFLFPLFFALAFLCLLGAGLAHDAPFAFHASLGCVASLAAGFFILNRYYDRPAELPPQEINGRPNYYLGRLNLPPLRRSFGVSRGSRWGCSSLRSSLGRR